MEEEIWINIISSTGKRFSVALRAGSRIDEFKDLLAKRSRYAHYKENEMKLIYKGDTLEDDRTLDSYGLQSNHTIYVEGAKKLLFKKTDADTITGVPDTSQVVPVITMMMQILLSSSLYMKQIISQNPQLQSIFDSNPQLRAMIQNPEPEVFCLLTSPQMMQDPENELYQKSFEVATKSPKSQLEPMRQNSTGHSIPSEDTVAGPSTSFDAMGLQTQRSSDRKYEICGWVILVGIVALRISKSLK